VAQVIDLLLANTNGHYQNTCDRHYDHNKSVGKCS